MHFLLFLLFSLPVLIFLALVCISFFTPWPKRDKNFFLRPRKKFHFDDDYFSFLVDRDDIHHIVNYTKPEIYLTVVIPARNEEHRLTKMLDECLIYLEKRAKTEKHFSYEVIIVDDGSEDGTLDVASRYCEKNKSIFMLKLEKNLGKGGAVRSGVLCARGEFILFCDADGATKFSDFKKLELEMRRCCNGEASDLQKKIDWTHPSVVVGSRAHLQRESIAKRSVLRTFLMYAFHAVVYAFTVRSVRDTQCGFKLFSRAAASRLFLKIHIEGWAFDVEILYLAEKLNYSIKEVAVEWTEIDGSKVTPFISWFQMGRDIILIWFRYAIGIWKMTERIK